MSIEKKLGVVLGLGLGLAFLLTCLIAGSLYWTTTQLIYNDGWVAHSHVVLDKLDLLLSMIKDAETGQRGYLLTDEQSYLEPYNEALATWEKLSNDLKTLTYDNGYQQARLDALRPLMERKFAELAKTIELRDKKVKAEGDGDAALELVKTDKGKEDMDKIRALVKDMRDEETRLLGERDAQSRGSAQTAHYLTLVGLPCLAALLILVGILSLWFVRSSVRKLGEEVSPKAEKLRQELAQAHDELQLAKERARTLEMICQAFGRPIPDSGLSAERGETGSFQPLFGRALPRQLGHYQLLEQIGEGGMGAVYRAMHTRLKRVVALKVLPPRLMADAKAVARFQREMEAVGKLDHPNIVRASDAGEADGWHFLVMELVEGMDLQKLTALRGTQSIPDACEICRQAADALQHAHEHGLVYRDVKPSNLLLTYSGQVKVLDLGLARLYGDEPVSEVLTASGTAMGTPDYMAPEQAFDSKSVDIRADIYSLGCTLYKLLAGRPPFGDPKYDSAARKFLAHAQTPPPPIRELRRDVPDDLAAILDRLLAKNPADRYGAPAEVALAMQAHVAGHHLTAMLSAQAGETRSVKA